MRIVKSRGENDMGGAATCENEPDKALVSPTLSVQSFRNLACDLTVSCVSVDGQKH
jgi:hypothetical protein